MTTPHLQELLGVIESCVSPITARSVLSSALQRLGRRPDQVTRATLGPDLLREIERGLKFFRVSKEQIAVCTGRLKEVCSAVHDQGMVGREHASSADSPDSSDGSRCSIEIREEDDIVGARTHVRDLARNLGFSTVDQVKIATVVSELTRNIVAYAGTGSIVARPLSGPERGLEIVARDNGPGISNLEQILSGAYVSKTGMGLGLVGSRRLMDDFSIQTGNRGTTVVVKKHLR